MSVHADSPPPKTLISYGARDSVQTSTPPDEISFWVQQTSPFDKHSKWCWMQILPVIWWAAVSFVMVIWCRCVSERLKKQQLVWICPSHCGMAHSSRQHQRGRSHLQELKQWPTGGFSFPCLFNRCASWRSKSCFCRDGVSKPVLSPDTPPIFRSEVTAESSVEANHKNDRLSVKWGYSKLSVNMSVRQRKRARGKMGGC